jgi:hypothetical protein
VITILLALDRCIYISGHLRINALGSIARNVHSGLMPTLNQALKTVAGRCDSQSAVDGS